MQTSDLPARFPAPFANSAGSSYIRDIPAAHQTASGTDAPASLEDGFPPETFLPESSGGIPPNGKDFNGILKQITKAVQWAQAGGPAIFDSAFSTAVGGYPKGARLASTVSAGVEWVSTAENNTTDPDSVGAANWLRVGVAAVSLGTPGFEKRDSGVMEQWGSVFIGTDAATTVTFPEAFPVAVYNVQLSWIDNHIGSGSPQGASGFSSPSLSGFTIYNDGFARTHHWRALGRWR
jgi:hypothetical protein